VNSDARSIYDMTFILSSLKAIASAAMYATEADTLDGTFERIATIARDLVGARYAALGIPNGKGGLEHFRFAGIDPTLVEKIGDPPKGQGLLGAIIQERRAIRLDNMQDDPRSIGFPNHHPEMSRFLGVPIIVSNKLYGMLYLTDKINGEIFTEQDQQIVETVAGYAALAIAGAQLREGERRLAQLEERERIGMELHDGVIQSLYAVGMYIELQRSAPQIPGQNLAHIVHDLDSIISDIRKYIQNLKPNDEATQPLEHCFRDLITRLHVPSTLAIDIVTESPIRLDENVYEAVCQMANEAISNVIRHANATQLTIAIASENNCVRVTFEDNGTGFDSTEIRSSSGLGLHNLQRRAELNKGTLVVESTKGKGTRIELKMPLQL